MKYAIGDEIIVTIGKDKGRKGKIEKVIPKTNMVLIPGLNVVKRHKKRKNEKEAGGIIEIPKPMVVSKIALLCPKCNQPTRIGYLVVNQEKHRVCRKCDQNI